MRFPIDLADSLFRLACAIAFACLPPLAMGILLEAEGPLPLLAAFQFVSVLALFFARPVGRRPPGKGDAGSPGVARPVGISSAAILCAIAVLTVLVQLNIARRSLAEAWLELARAGEAFGFFSFFATELYALLCLGASALAVFRGIVPGTAALLSATFLALGIVGGKGYYLAFSVLFFLSLPAVLAASPGRGEAPGATAAGRARAALVPSLVALAFSVFPFFLPSRSPSGPVMRPVDLTPLATKLAPAFPLLMDVPGYGFGVGSERLERSVYLSDGVLFDAEGEGPSVRYLVTASFGKWTGNGWIETDDPGPELAVSFFPAVPPPAAGSLRLTLRGDFYSLLPVERDSAEVRLSRKIESVKAHRERGVRFPRSVERGLVADLIPASDSSPGRDLPEASSGVPPDLYLDAGKDGSGRMGELVASLRKKGGAVRTVGTDGAADAGVTAGAADAGADADPASDRSFVEAALAYLREGFVYSLRTGSSSSGDYDLEDFLFKERKGFCVHFASAFVLICRRGGLPARLVEGFRLELDEEGKGSVRGVNSHAWAEVWMEGAWRRFEPTPPYAAEDPFSFLERGDRESGRQLRAVFGNAKSEGHDASSAGSPPVRPAAVVLSLLLAATAVFIGILGRRAVRTARDPEYRLRLRSGRMVRRFRSLGVRGPEVVGWMAWARAAEEAEAVAGRAKAGWKRGKPDPAAIAAGMLSLAFDRDD